MTAETPYLIAHKVRKAPAFDIAIKMECPMCDGIDGKARDKSCHECDDLGYWWIIPTSGHRAYPYWSERLEYLVTANHDNGFCHLDYVPDMPDSTPDHYAANDRLAPEPSRVEALRSLLTPKAPTPNLPRRPL